MQPFVLVLKGAREEFFGISDFLRDYQPNIGIREDGIFTDGWSYWSERACGVIGKIVSGEHRAEIRKLKKPYVSTSAYNLKLKVPRVVADDRAIGQLVAQHLIERQVKRFACISSVWGDFHKLRVDGYRRELRSHGYNADNFICEMRFSKEPQLARFMNWLETQIRPVGLFIVEEKLTREAVAAVI